MPKKQGSNKHRKVGRNAIACRSYASSHRREHNKVRRLKKRLITHPDDKVAVAAIERAMVVIRGF